MKWVFNLTLEEKKMMSVVLVIVGGSLTLIIPPQPPVCQIALKKILSNYSHWVQSLFALENILLDLVKIVCGLKKYVINIVLFF